MCGYTQLALQPAATNTLGAHSHHGHERRMGEGDEAFFLDRSLVSHHSLTHSLPLGWLCFFVFFPADLRKVIYFRPTDQKQAVSLVLDAICGSPVAVAVSLRRASFTATLVLACVCAFVVRVFFLIVHTSKARFSRKQASSFSHHSHCLLHFPPPLLLAPLVIVALVCLFIRCFLSYFNISNNKCSKRTHAHINNKSPNRRTLSEELPNRHPSGCSPSPLLGCLSVQRSRSVSHSCSSH